MKKTVISWNMIKDGLRRMKVASFIYAALIVLAQFVVPLLSSLSQMNNIYNNIATHTGKICCIYCEEHG